MSTDDGLTGEIKPALPVQQVLAARNAAAGLADLSCVDGLLILINAISNRTAKSRSGLTDGLLEKLTDCIEAAKLADLKP